MKPVDPDEARLAPAPEAGPGSEPETRPLDEAALRRRLHAAVMAGPDPDEADARLHRYADAAREHGGLPACVPDETAAQLLPLFFGQSASLSRQLIGDPRRLAALASDPHLRREKSEAALHADRAAAVAAAPDAFSGLRRFRNAEYLRLGARELGYGAAEEVGRELSGLASACLQGAIEAAQRELVALHGEPLTDEDGPPRRCRFVVLGMGKLGGEELNFSSDIDLVYLYESDHGRAGKLSLHEFHTHLADRITRLVGATTDEGSCFRVDLRLRPEGTQGPLVNSLPAAERYYESFGRPWERQAFIKARPVAGDGDLGDEALAMLAPFVWPRLAGDDVVASVRALMALVRSELSDENDLKLGRGGIREVEFFVQALQRVHGGRRAALREKGTLRALDKLLFAGLVNEREHRALGDAYVFLRRVEHRVQIDEMRQTHALPVEASRRALLARRLGMGDTAAFDERLGRHRREVSTVYATLGEPPPSPSLWVQALVDPQSDRAALESALGALGFRDVEASADELELLRKKPRSPFAPSATGAAAVAAPKLLEEAAASPDPDLALRRLVDLVVRGASGEAVFRLMAEVPAIGRLLLSLFGTSDFLSRIFVAHPELVEPLLLDESGRIGKSRDAHAAALRALLRLDTPAALDEEDRLNLLRRYRNEEVLRVGLRDVSGELDVDEVSADLSALAEACLGATLEVVAPAVYARWGRPRGALCVLGLGKLGGGEMTYSSDLDLVFVFSDEDAEAKADLSPIDPPISPQISPSISPSISPPISPSVPPAGGRRAESDFEAMSRLAQRLISGLHAYLPAGRLYEVDTRLRPSGMQGALVSSLSGFARYHAGSSALWERQALIKARTVAGDAALGARVEAIARRQVWEGPALDAAQAALEVGRLRARMERELSHEAQGRFNIKSGRGGLVDVEFLVQYLQLIHGPRLPGVRLRATRPALDALHAAGVLDDAEHAELSLGYRFLRRLENRMRIVHDRQIAELRAEMNAQPSAPPSSAQSVGQLELRKLARRLGYHGVDPGARLLDEYRLRTDGVRAVYARYLPTAATG